LTLQGGVMTAEEAARAATLSVVEDASVSGAGMTARRSRASPRAPQRLDPASPEILRGDRCHSIKAPGGTSRPSPRPSSRSSPPRGDPIHRTGQPLPSVLRLRAQPRHRPPRAYLPRRGRGALAIIVPRRFEGTARGRPRGHRGRLSRRGAGGRGGGPHRSRALDGRAERALRESHAGRASAARPRRR
jgi:hypothetical protein